MASAVQRVYPLGFPWSPPDPFLFCAHHLDRYPAGNAQLGPDASLAGRSLGMDFTLKDGFRMYHGERVPGFPQHPHRGFETITLVSRGFVDHTDSLGAAARFGDGDVQWMTAGAGIVHAEMFPLLNPTTENPLELFQIWLNLPRTKKLVDPHFSILWSHTVPTIALGGEGRPKVDVTVVAGGLAGVRAPPPPPHSWAHVPDNEVSILLMRFAAGARMRLPRASAGLSRTVFFFEGVGLEVDGVTLAPYHGAQLRSDAEPVLSMPAQKGSALLLQGRPIGEPVAQHGPMVMNTRDEIMRAFMEYRATGFGGWPWPSDDPVHPREQARFARHPDGRVDLP